MGVSWCMDETYILVNGVWNYVFRAVDKAGDDHRFSIDGQA